MPVVLEGGQKRFGLGVKRTITDLSAIPRNVLGSLVLVQSFYEFFGSIGQRDIFPFIGKLFQEAIPDPPLFAVIQRLVGEGHGSSG